MGVSVELLVQRVVAPGVITVGGAGDRDRRFDPQVADLQRSSRFADPLVRNSLGADFVGRPSFQFCKDGLEIVECLIIVGLQHAAFGKPSHVGQSHAVGAEDAGVGVHQHITDSQFPGDGTGMLGTSPTESDQHVVSRIVTACDRDVADGPDHVGDRDLQKPLGEFGWSVAAAHRGFGAPGAEGLESRGDRVGVERKRESVWENPAQVNVEIGDGQRSPTAVTGGAGIGTGTGRTDSEFHTDEIADAASACCHSLDGQHWRDDPHSRLGRFEFPLVTPVEPRDVRACATHVETD